MGEGSGVFLTTVSSPLTHFRQRQASIRDPCPTLMPVPIQELLRFNL